jgi:UDP-2,3-diacylglucosamine hydrolase
MGKEIYFVSDAHFGIGSKDTENLKQEKFLSFLEYITPRAGHLYILGDLFDFWFEYRSTIFKKHFRVLHGLAKVRERGVRITYLAGNHDFDLGTFLKDDLGIEVSAGPLDVQEQGLRLFIAHGDGLITKERAYLLLKKFLRFPPHVWLFKLVHPDLGNFLAEKTSKISRRFLSKDKKFDFKEEFKAFARAKFAAGTDCLVLAHSHKPFIEQLENHLVINTGDWIKKFSYVVLCDGQFELKFWN